FLPSSLHLARENRNLSWAKLVLVWMGVYLVTISLMETKLPWYVFPIYPSLALVIGAKLGEIEDLPVLSSYPRFWVVSLTLLALVATAGSIYFSFVPTAKSELQLQLIFAAAAMTMALAAILAERGDRQFLKVLFWGSYVSLFLFMKSNYWVWELAERYPVQPVANMIREGTPSGAKIYTSNPEHRPSLNFYSDRNIVPASFKELQDYWHNQKQPYLLLDKSAVYALQLDSLKVIDQAEGWKLVTKDIK
ncbi:phospholipid carrier-dependent glycosyltransferase, partial [Fischerella thermalis CCMEE 5273]